MLNRNCGRTTLRKRLISALAVILVLNLLGCEQPELPEPSPPNLSAPQPTTQMAEVSPPKAIQMLHQPLDVYQPQVTILSPQPDEVLQDNTLNVQLQVQDLPLFRDETLGLGPHLQIILDNQPLDNLYTLDQPLVLSDLEAGTHTLRIFAAYPWEESFKNDGAYAQTTFHVFTKTPENNPNPQLPLLTYNQPRGTYGAEPVLLDFYLANAPLHLVAQENPEDEIVDWRIRVTVNGDSFILAQWQPIYIKGIKPGKNWVQLEYLDELGEPLINVYNKTARVFTYNPNSQDTLSKLVRGELSIAEARPIVDPGYDVKAVTPEIEETPEPDLPIPPVELTPEVEEIPETETSSEVEITPLADEQPETSEPDISPEVETVPSAEEIPETLEPLEETEDIEVIPETDIPSTVEETSVTAVEEALPSEEESVEKPVSAAKEELEQLPQTEIETKPITPVPVETATPPKTNGWFNRIQGQIPPLPILENNNSEASPSITPTPTPEPSETDNVFKRIFSRFQQIPLFQQKTSQPEPEPVQTLPEIVNQAPIPEPTQAPEPEESPELVPDELKPSTEISPTPQPTVETIEPVIEPEPVPEMVEETPVVEPEPVPEIVEETPVVEPEPVPEMIEETPVIEAEPIGETVEETPVVEPEPVSEEPVVITPEAEPETLPEIVEETSLVELEVELEESNLRP
ncbi:hypothetical protein [Lyngbya sp. PCC 8106]|uniref:hypothetical protein n=1 Tax=Lyngbya sp. (strain PCC 8106) TaxID=313612 RepID=UPI0012EAF827|nr:hypothetical protein [Lyngbya sp. PCC 8106]